MPSRARITHASAQIASTVTHSTARITHASAQTVTVHSTARITTAYADIVTSHSRARITHASAQASVPADMQARPGAARFVESYVPVVLDGGGSTGPWVQASWVYVSDTRVAQLGLPPLVPVVVDGADTDSVVTVLMPAHPVNYQATFRLIVTDGVSIVSADVTHTVYAWLYWYLDATGKILPEVIEYL